MPRAPRSPGVLPLLAALACTVPERGFDTPRTPSEVILGFGPQDTAAFRVPATGGTETPPHALEGPLEAQLAARPKP